MGRWTQKMPNGEMKGALTEGPGLPLGRWSLAPRAVGISLIPAVSGEEGGACPVPSLPPRVLGIWFSWSFPVQPKAVSLSSNHTREAKAFCVRLCLHLEIRDQVPWGLFVDFLCQPPGWLASRNGIICSTSC